MSRDDEKKKTKEYIDATARIKELVEGARDLLVAQGLNVSVSPKQYDEGALLLKEESNPGDLYFGPTLCLAPDMTSGYYGRYTGNVRLSDGGWRSGRIIAEKTTADTIASKFLKKVEQHRAEAAWERASRQRRGLAAKLKAELTEGLPVFGSPVEVSESLDITLTFKTDDAVKAKALLTLAKELGVVDV